MLSINNLQKIVFLIRSGQSSVLFYKIITKIYKDYVHSYNSKLRYNNILKWIKENYNYNFIYNKNIYKNKVDIIIPIYNGYEYLDNLFNTIIKTEVPFRLIIINDNSTDERIIQFLENISRNFNIYDFIIINNNENLGFIKSVNKGLKISENHVVIVNTDIEFPQYWLERIITPFYIKRNIASTTPFTNSGTICSFPILGEDNELLPELTLNSIDNAFQKIKPVYQEIPSGVGFCMAMNKKAIKKIGIFDEIYGLGYCEENDWCQRAVKKRFKNVIVENLFIWHRHCGSFLVKTKNYLLKNNLNILNKKYPNYFIKVSKFYNKNIHYELRTTLLCLLLSNSNQVEKILFFDHNLGGGTNLYFNNFKITNHNNVIYYIQYNKNSKIYYFHVYWKNYVDYIKLNSINDITYFIEYFRINKLIVSHIMSYPDIFLLLNNIITWKYKYNIKLVMLIHDYYSVCPVYFLIDYNNNFCGYNEFKQCSSCLKNNIKKYKHMLFYNNEDIIFWRSEWKQFLVKCDIIETFSNSSKNIIETIFGSLPNINTILHTVDYINPKKQSKDFLTIGFLGKISFYKGLNIIQEMSDIIEEEDLRIKLVHIGYPEHPINGKNYIFTGEYLHHEISGLSKKNNIDIFFISSIWPETFSYTTQEIIEMDIPLACFDIGAPAERIKLYKKGLIIPEISARCAIQTLYEWYKLNF